MMQTITFYSYKGGVGRTLALANVATLLAEMGRKVFVLDCDLEAPGMHYKLLRDKNDRARMMPGFIDFAYEYFEGDGFKPIKEHVTKIVRAGDKPLTGTGEVLLMPAGQPLWAEYWNRLVKIRWPDRFYEEYGEGFLFLLELKRRIEEECNPDVLLIDARTGVTEVGGVALTLLPDKVVFLFVNNDESREGTREIIRSISRTLPEGDKLPEVVPVLTRVPEDMDPLPLEELRAYFSESVPDDVKPPPIDRVLVLHSDRELERKEELYLGGDGNKVESILYGDYDELFGALNLASERDRATMKLRAFSQRAARAESILTQGTYDKQASDVAMKWRKKALELAERSFDIQDANYASTLLAYAQTAQKVARQEEALNAFRSIQSIYPDIGVLNISQLADVASAVVLLSVDLLRFIDVPVALTKAIPHHRELGDDGLIRFLGQVRAVYEGGPGRAHTSYGTVLRELWGALLASSRQDVAEAVLLDAIKFFRELGDEGLLDLADARHTRARILRHRGERKQEADELQEVEKTYRGLFGAEDPRSQEVRREWTDALEALGLNEDARAVRERGARAAPRGAPPNHLPARRARVVRGGPEIVSFSIPLAVVTPILGGASQTRKTDIVDVIRVPSLRGQLRFWWRALYGGKLAGQVLYAAERRLWGGAADQDDGRSEVEIRVTVETKGEIDESSIRPFGSDATPGAYALWPARETRGENPQPTAPRRAPGTRFTLEVRCPVGDEKAVRNTVRALILFGGYGGRTRRGAGSFTVERDADRAAWLPAEATREALTALFGEDVLAALAGRGMDDLPLLHGAGLRAGRPLSDPSAAWKTALDWLTEFRQGQPHAGAFGSHDARFARVRGDQRRPGRSNWPEADKVRRLSGRGPWAHEPPREHGERPVWPRAGFGLPIVAQFQRKDRSGARYAEREPENYELRWHSVVDKKIVEHDRLASPLIVKALPLADGRFVPCALWLFRGYPDGTVGLKGSDPRTERSRAGFDVLVAQGDKAMFAPLDVARSEPVGMRLRTAFLDWLGRRSGIVVVAP
jgi:CRISPR-associated protein Cmr1